MVVEIPLHETKELYPEVHKVFCRCETGDRREPHGKGYEYFKQVSLELKERVHGKKAKKGKHSLVERQNLA